MRQLVASCLGIVLVTMPLAAQENDHDDWSVVSSLAVGTSVEVHRQDNGTIRGLIASVSDTSLILKLKTQMSTTVDRQNITRLYLTGRRHVALGALIGGAAGAGAGAVVGVAICGRGWGCTKGEGARNGAVIFGAIGALVGTATGTHRGRQLVYHVPKTGIADLRRRDPQT